MRTTLLLLLGVGILSGCPAPPDRTGPAVNTVERDGLEVSLSVPKRTFRVGESFRATVTARNTTGDPIHIVARSGAKVHIRVQRHGEFGWEEVLEYPQAAVMMINPWTLPGRKAETFTLNLKVEPNWPTGEPLRLVAVLNGREAVSPGVVIRVEPRG